jgi:hypothetical protein
MAIPKPRIYGSPYIDPSWAALSRSLRWWRTATPGTVYTFAIDTTRWAYLLPWQFPQLLAGYMNTLDANSYAGSFNETTGRLTLSGTASFQLDFSATGGQNIAPFCGFNATVRAGATSHTSDFQLKGYWVSPVAALFDSKEYPERPGSNVVVAQGGKHVAIVEQAIRCRDVDFAHMPIDYTLKDSEGSNTWRAFENIWDLYYARFRYWDETVVATGTDYFLDQAVLERFRPVRDRRANIWSFGLSMRRYVS